MRVAAIREAARGKLFGQERAVPVRIDRYVIEAPLGRGGMGEVFAAYDPELGRKVALKLVGRNTAADPDANARLLREARALARLDHACIVPIHDAGSHDGRIWLAMELIEGETLRGWLTKTRARAAVHDVLLRAGRGLAAAHAAGILHRDFKPDNVMVAPANAEQPASVRVTDFGLAASADPSAPISADVHRSEPSSGEGATISGESLQMGTVGYLAAELLQGHRATAASDQFAFCVTAFEALCGRRPFVGATPAEVARATVKGELRWPPKADVPTWVRTIVARGLAVDPSARFPDMDTLLRVLERDPAIARRRIIGWSAALLIGGGGLAAAILTPRGPTCTRDEARLAGVWDEPRKAAIARAFEAAHVPFADDAWRGAERRVDRWTDAWLDARVDACAATHVRGEQSSELLDLRMACFDQRLDDLRELGDALARADAETVQRAVQAANELGNFDACADAVALRERMPPPQDAEAVASVERELGRVRALRRTGDYRDAIADAEAAIAHARAVGHRPTLAEALLERSLARAFQGEAQLAAEELRATVSEGLASRHDRVAARAASVLVAVVGFQLGDPTHGLEWSDNARALLDRLGGDDEIEASRLNNLGLVRDGEGRFDEAEALYREALALRRSALGPEHPAVADSLLNIAAVELATKRYDEAEPTLKEALELVERTLGPRHPDYGSVLLNLSVAAAGAKRMDEALRHAQRAVAVLGPALGPDSAAVAMARNNLARVLARSNRAEEALPEAQAAVEIAQRAFGDDDTETARFRRVLADILLRLDRREEAQQVQRRAIATLERAEDPTLEEARAELAKITKTDRNPSP